MSLHDADSRSVSTSHVRSEDVLMSDATSLSDDALTDVTEQDVRAAALAVPDVDGQALAAPQQTAPGDAVSTTSSSSIDWTAVLGVSAQGLDAATTATSFGFQAARTATSLSLQLAKVITQSVVALPAMAIDGAMTGTSPWSNDQSGTPSALQLSQATVGGLFDAISFLAVGGIDMGSALTSAGLGAAGAGVEGVRRAVGSEVLRSLSSFAALVKREWNASDTDDLPPGGIPAYSALGVTRALTAWVLIQLVTRVEYEKRMLRGLQEVDTLQLRIECQKLGDARKAQRARHQAASALRPAPQVGDRDIRAQVSTNKGSREVHITSEQTLPEAEGDLIGATIGLCLDDEDDAESERTGGDQTHRPLTTPEALIGLQRYSRLVLGVYGGVALAWLGVLPQDDDSVGAALGRAMDESDAHGNVVNGEAPTVHQPQNTTDSDALHSDEADFLAAASLLDEPHTTTGLSTPDGQSMPGAFGQAVASTSTNNASGHAAPSAPGPPVGVSASTTASSNARATPSAPQRTSSAYSYLDLLSGRHDDDLFHRTARLKKGTAQAGSYDEEGPPRPVDTSAPARPSRPRYYVVTDHDTRVVSLVIRGTLSVGDLAADLTCESVPFLHEFDDVPKSGQAAGADQSVRFPTHAIRLTRSDENMDDGGEDLVHEGMYITAQEIGLSGRPVHRAVKQALLLHSTYALEIAGHSLGAGIASLLAMMWSSSRTGRTTISSGLPPGRPVRAYAFAVPCIATQALAKRYAATVTSFVSGYDLVPRLSLGAVLDIRNACAWLCYEEAQARAATDSTPSNPSILRPTPFSLNRLTQRAFQYQAGTLSQEDAKNVEVDLLVLRKTLEANMRSVHLFPPGLVHYAFEPSVFKTPTTLLARDSTSDAPIGAEGSAAAAAEIPANGPRLFRVRDDADLSDIFGQIVFYPSMISGHMPHVYSQQIHALSGSKM